MHHRAIGAAVPVARVFGADVFVHWSMTVVPLALLALIGRSLPAPEAIGWTAFWTLAYSVLVWTHEMAHVWAARRLGVPAGVVLISPFGPLGHDDPPTASPRGEMLCALAGPAVHALWIGPAWIAFAMAPADAVAPWRVGTEVFLLGNAALAVLNLLPFYPLDGGRFLRGAIAARTSVQRAEIWSAYAGYAGAIAMGLAGLAMLLSGGASSVAWALLLIAVGIVNLMSAQRLLFTAQFLTTSRQAAHADLLRERPAAPDFLDEDALSEGLDAALASPGKEREAKPETRPESSAARRRRLQERIDVLLDRINEVGGIENLTAEERSELDAASEGLRSETTGS